MGLMLLFVGLECILSNADNKLPLTIAWARWIASQ